MKIFRRLVVGLLLVAALLVVGDRLAAHLLERGITESLSASPGVLPVAEGPTSGGEGEGSQDGDLDVQVEGIPLLTQLADGELESLRVHLPGYDVAIGGADVTLHLEDIDAHLLGVSTAQPHRAHALSATALITSASLGEALGTTGIPARVSSDDHGVTMTLDVAGGEATVSLALSPGQDGRSLVLTPTEASLGGVEVPSRLLTGLSGSLPDISLEALPQGVGLSQVHTDTSGIHVELIGSEVDLGDFDS